MRHLFLVSALLLLSAQITSAQLSPKTFVSNTFEFLQPPHTLDATQEAYVKEHFKPDTLYLWAAGLRVQVSREDILKLSKAGTLTEAALVLKEGDTSSFSLTSQSTERILEEIQGALKKRDVYDVTLSTGEHYLLDSTDWRDLGQERSMPYLGRTMVERQVAQYRGALFMMVLMIGLIFITSLTDHWGYAAIQLTPSALVISCYILINDITRALDTYDLAKIGWRGMAPVFVPVAIALIASWMPKHKKAASSEPSTATTSEESTEA